MELLKGLALWTCLREHEIVRRGMLRMLGQSLNVKSMCLKQTAPGCTLTGLTLAGHAQWLGEAAIQHRWLSRPWHDCENGAKIYAKRMSHY